MASPGMSLRLEHITGLRFWLCLWITLFHIARSPDPDPKPADAIDEPLPWWFYELGRRLMDESHVHMGVSTFVALSGFVTQRAYGSKPLDCGRPLLEWYVRRLDRVVFTTWVTMLVDLVFFMILMNPGKFQPEKRGEIVTSFFFLSSWFAPSEDSPYAIPNFPSWAIGAAFIPSWLIYPFTTQRLLSGRRSHEIAAALAISYMAAVLPELYLFATQATVDDYTATVLYVFPARWLFPFFFGAASSEALSSWAARNEGKGGVGSGSVGTGLGLTAERAKETTPLQAGLLSASSSSGRYDTWGVIADLCVVGYVSLLCFTPGGSRIENVTEAGVPITVPMHDTYSLLYLHGTLPLVGLYLVASCASPSRGLFASLCAHPACVALGMYTFEVYLFAVPIFHLIGFHSTKHHLPTIGVLVLVWTVAGVYAEFVQNPFTAWVRRKISRPAEGPYPSQGSGV